MTTPTRTKKISPWVCTYRYSRSPTGKELCEEYNTVTGKRRRFYTATGRVYRP